MLTSPLLKRLWLISLILNYDTKKCSNASAESIKIHPGANSLCDGNPRIRRDWDLIDSSAKELFKEAIEKSIDLGLYQKFRVYHADLTSAIQSHETCAFILWHRRYLLAFENMLRSLDDRFACLTVPYWNIMEHYKDQDNELCSSFGNCARVVSDLGGTPSNYDDSRTYSGIEASGALFRGRPISRLIDDDGKAGIVRDDVLWVELPPSCDYDKVAQLYSTSTSYVDFARKIQTTLHDDVHDLIGGLMPTFSSPSDPLFMVWHSLIDLLLYMWEICNIQNNLTQSDIFSNPSSSSSSSSFDPFHEDAVCTYSERATKRFPHTNATTEMHMKHNNIDIRNDPHIGLYFRDIGLTFHEVASYRHLNENEFTYDHLTPPLWNILADPVSCPAGAWYTSSPTPAPVSRGPVRPPDLCEFAQWIEDVRVDLGVLYPDWPEKADAYVSFLLCALGGEKVVPSEEYRSDFLRGDLSVGGCNFLWSKFHDDDAAPSIGGGGGGVVGVTPVASPPYQATPVTTSIDWIIPEVIEEEEAYPDRRVRVGDTVVFTWEGFHNVYIHPTGTCDKTSSILVGSEGQNATYTFQDSDVGTIVFACDVQSHCILGQIVKFIVKERSERSNSTSAPTATVLDSSTPSKSSASGIGFAVGPVFALLLVSSNRLRN